MTTRTRVERPGGGWLRGLLAAALLATACFTRGPTPPDAASIVAIEVVKLDGNLEPRSIADPARVSELAGSGWFGAGGWQTPLCRDFRPLYRVELVARDGSRTRYWLGQDNGFWLAASDASGSLDPSRYVSLNTSGGALFAIQLTR